MLLKLTDSSVPTDYPDWGGVKTEYYKLAAHICFLFALWHTALQATSHEARQCGATRKLARPKNIYFGLVFLRCSSYVHRRK